MNSGKDSVRLAPPPVPAIARSVIEPTSPLQIAEYRRFWMARFLAVFSTLSMVVLLGYQVYDVARADYGLGPRDAAFMLGLLGAGDVVDLVP